MEKVVGKKKALVRRKECVACGTCANVCSKASIKIYKGVYATVDIALCCGCGKCRKVCPASVIDLEVVSA